MFAYFDETGTSGGAERLTGVAGYLFDQAGVTKFRELYQAKVEPLIPPNDKGIRVFSASGVNAGRDHYHMPGRAKEAIFGAMVEALSETVIMGAVVAVTPEDYAEGIKGRYIRVRSSDPRDSIALRAGSKYSACLLRCIEQINTWLDLEKRDVDGGIEYTFEPTTTNCAPPRGTDSCAVPSVVVEKPPREAQNPPMADRASQSIYLGLGVVGLALLAFVMFRYLGG